MLLKDAEIIFHRFVEYFCVGLNKSIYQVTLNFKCNERKLHVYMPKQVILRQENYELLNVCIGNVVLSLIFRQHIKNLLQD